MVLALDPEVATAMAPIIKAMASTPALASGDVEGRRQRAQTGLAAIINTLPETPSVKRTDHSIPTPDGTSINVAEFRKTGTAKPSKAILYIHGGGMIFGSVDMFEKSISAIAARTNVPIFAVSYRLAPEFPHPIPVTDCWTALQWLSSHADELAVDPGRITVMGGSAGGGLAAGTALMARDQGLNPPLAKQILIYPMLDDRNLEALEGIEGLATWKVADSKFLSSSIDRSILWPKYRTVLMKVCVAGPLSSVPSPDLQTPKLSPPTRRQLARRISRVYRLRTSNADNWISLFLKI